MTNNSELQNLNTEWHTLRKVKEIQKLSENIEDFWSQAEILKYGDNTFMFSILTCNLFILPHSSPNLEGMFYRLI